MGERSVRKTRSVLFWIAAPSDRATFSHGQNEHPALSRRGDEIEEVLGLRSRVLQRLEAIFEQSICRSRSRKSHKSTESEVVFIAGKLKTSGHPE
jgi:hypothetical protein